MRKQENIYNPKKVKVWRYTFRASYTITRCDSGINLSFPINYGLHLTCVTEKFIWNDPLLNPSGMKQKRVRVENGQTDTDSFSVPGVCSTR